MSRAGDAVATASDRVSLLDHLLRTTSRTFALTIPLLHEPTRREVTIAYLLFRVADTLEDATLWAPGRKSEELLALAGYLEAAAAKGGGPASASDFSERWTADPPLAHQGYLELLAAFPEVMRNSTVLRPEALRLVASHTARTCRAMAAFVVREEGGALRLRDLDDLRAYCYAVAGIVGEMLTELFLLEREELRPSAGPLRRDAAAFGEALQLVNVLKDRAADAVEGRYYLPAGLPENGVFELARADLRTASGYCARLARSGADRGLVAFTALPILLARATLDRVRERGAGSKLTRDEVAGIVVRLHEALDGADVAAWMEEGKAGGQPPGKGEG